VKAPQQVEWANSPVVARCSAQVLAWAASVLFHTSGGTPTAARSLLCTASMLLAKSALKFPVLLVGFVILVGCMLGVVVLHVELSVPVPQPDVGVVGVDGDGVDVVLHVELSVPGPQPDVGVVGVDGDGVDVVLHVELSVPGPQPATGCCAFPVLLFSCAFAVAANTASIRIPAAATDAIKNIMIGLSII